MRVLEHKLMFLVVLVFFFTNSEAMERSLEFGFHIDPSLCANRLQFISNFHSSLRSIESVLSKFEVEKLDGTGKVLYHTRFDTKEGLFSAKQVSVRLRCYPSSLSDGCVDSSYDITIKSSSVIEDIANSIPTQSKKVYADHFKEKMEQNVYGHHVNCKNFWHRSGKVEDLTVSDFPSPQNWTVGTVDTFFKKFDNFWDLPKDYPLVVSSTRHRWAYKDVVMVIRGKEVEGDFSLDYLSAHDAWLGSNPHSCQFEFKMDETSSDGWDPKNLQEGLNLLSALTKFYPNSIACAEWDD